jgi:hypothetical protein
LRVDSRARFALGSIRAALFTPASPSAAAQRNFSALLPEVVSSSCFESRLAAHVPRKDEKNLNENTKGDRPMMNKGYGNFVCGFLAGAAPGAVGTLLAAPRPGRELRREIQDSGKKNYATR